MTKSLFIHQNCPGQFVHLAPHLAAKEGNDVTFITRPGRPDIPGVRKIEYAPHRKVTPKVHPYLISSEAAVLNGQGVARVALQLQKDGYTPDVIIGNPGWGETLFLKDVWPEVPLILLVEFYYRGRGSDVGFDPEFNKGIDTVFRARTRAGVHLLALEAADYVYAPTAWQRDQIPRAFRDAVRVIHDGIDVEHLRPDPTATFELPDGRTLSRSDEVLTYVARNLEPYRGFHTFMRALPDLLRRRPNVQVVIVGGDEVSYGTRPEGGGLWRETLLSEIGPLPDRVTFTGKIPYVDFKRLMQVSSVHLYLTYPFVLSWSMLEAMSMGAFLVGSATPPVEEVIEDGQNGWLVDFFDAEALSSRLAEALDQRNEVDELRAAARQTIVDRYALSQSLADQSALVDEALSKG